MDFFDNLYYVMIPFLITIAMALLMVFCFKLLMNVFSGLKTSKQMNHVVEVNFNLNIYLIIYYYCV